ncbi:MAG: hypothetical protein V1257_11765 [Candidatus Neomarinimicrobiota bacterium]|jgi:hypothetical protein|nr:hypothetical protein [Candidatus Neomarinimicrobiota bacterium]
MIESKHFRCYYKKEFPVDEYGRPGGFYSLADLPIMKNDVLSRKGIVEAKNAEHQMYRVRDVEKGWEFWVPMTDVSMGEIDDGDI